LMNEANEEARKQVKLRPLPDVIAYVSPAEIELKMRLLSAGLRDAPEAIAEVQSIAGQLGECGQQGRGGQAFRRRDRGG